MSMTLLEVREAKEEAESKITQALAELSKKITTIGVTVGSAEVGIVEHKERGYYVDLQIFETKILLDTVKL